jgi:hypothetical protein
MNNSRILSAVSHPSILPCDRHRCRFIGEKVFQPMRWAPLAPAPPQIQGAPLIFCFYESE